MKKIFMSALAVVLLTATAEAQQRGNRNSGMRDGMPQREMQRDMLSDINLTQSQKDKMKALREYGLEERNKIQANSSLSREQKAEAMRKLQQEMKEKREAILTPGQRAQLTERMQTMRENRERRTGRSENWQTLNDVQKEQVRDINETYNKKAEEIKKNTFLSKDAKQTQLKQLQEQKRKAMQNVLTPEQRQNIKDGKDKNNNNGPRQRRNDRPNLRS